MSSIPGLEHLAKDGWEIVRYDSVSQEEYSVGGEGHIERWICNSPSPTKRLIIRKIPKSKQYRQFANAAEYMPHWGKPVASKGDYGFDSIVSTSHFCVYVATAEKVQSYSMEEAFDKLTFADGSPFGVEVAE